MKKRILIRLAQMLIILAGISVLTFLLTYLAPGDPASAMYDSMGIRPSAEMLERTREEMGLNKSFLQQYMDWIIGVFHGDLGVSFSKGASVLSLLGERLPATMKLAVFSFVLMLIISVPLGIISAIQQNKIADYIIRFFSFLGISLPGFLIGLLLMYVFSLKLGLIKIAGNSEGIGQLLLPGITLATAMASKFSRQVRTAILEELDQDYIIGAKARGMSRREILLWQVLPNAMLPLLTMLGVSFGSLLGGTAVVEIVFTYPGIGILATAAVKARDYPLIQGFVLWIAVIYMAVNLLVDISYYLVDPRIRKGSV